MQDLVTPDLRALAVELKNLREETNRRFEKVNKQITDLGGEMREMRGELRAEVKKVCNPSSPNSSWTNGLASWKRKTSAESSCLKNSTAIAAGPLSLPE